MNEEQDFKQSCETFSKECMRPLVTQKEFVYIDADLLFDYKFGTLISFIKNGDEDFQKIRSHIQEYLDAPTLECAKFFPEMGVTEQQLIDRMNDPKYANVLAAISPPTFFMKDIGNCIRILNTINKSKETQRPLKITINQCRYDLHPHVRQGIVNAIRAVDAEVGVDFTAFRNWKEVPRDLLARQDVICVYDIRDFLAEGTTSQKLLVSDEHELAATDIIALAQSDLAEKDTELGLLNLQDIVSMLCNKFKFVKKTLMTEDNSHG